MAMSWVLARFPDAVRGWLVRLRSAAGAGAALAAVFGRRGFFLDGMPGF
jgi:hypothetical protein